MDASPAALRTVDLGVRYGGVTANDAVNVSVGRCELVGLIGPNGAGKTSFVDAVSGFARSEGEIWVAGRRIDRMPSHRRQRAGVGRTWQAGELFADLTVWDNLKVASQGIGLGSFLADIVAPARASGEPVVRAAIEAVGLEHLADRKPPELSLGQQKLAGVARGLVGNPTVVLLDEPAAGLDSQESRALGAELRRLTSEGLGMVLIDHDASFVFETCDVVYVMNFGRIIAAGPPDEVRNNEDVVDAYLGGILKGEGAS